jgi:hypothetical protein
VRLDRAGKMDQLTFAVGEVGLAKCRAGQHRRQWERGGGAVSPLPPMPRSRMR